MSKLDGQVALVTGASRGIGQAAALALARAGARVMLTARDGARLEVLAGEIVAAGGRAEAMACDVADYAQVARLAAATHARLGGVDVLVNNAAIIEPIERIADSDPALWARNLQVNLLGGYHMVRALLPGMLRRRAGRIVNLSSGAAHRPLEGWAAYSAAKAGLAMLMRAVALEAGGGGVRVIGLAPGTVDTEMQAAIRRSRLNPVSEIPRHKLAPPELPARAIVYLASGAADDLHGTEASLGDPAFRARVGLD